MAGPQVNLPLATFRFWAQYFRFETEGFGVLARTDPALIVAYHGGPWTFDLWMLAARMYDELGYFPRAVWHRVWWQIPALGGAVTELGGLPGPPTEADMARIKSQGQHLVVTPGGAKEGLRPFWRSHRVDFGSRRGYLRLAYAHDLPIIPVVSSGLDETFLGLSNAYEVSKRLFGREHVPAWLAVGLGGIWPLALPFPVKIRQRIGSPIRLGEESLEQAHDHVTGVLQSMLDELRREHGGWL
jgi:1-acyl-sn-glycerol-3-phosphate acyltransferase